MSNPLHTNDLETFLQKQADSHRMYPADKIWRNIQKEIHGEGRWPALTFVSIFIISALVVCTLMVKPEERLHKNTIVYSTQKEEVAVSRTKQSTKDAIAAAPVQYAYTEAITQQTLQQVSKDIIARNEKQTTLQPLAITQTSLFLIENKPAQTINETTLAAAKTAARQETAQLILIDAAQNNRFAEAANLFAVAKPVSNYFSSAALLNVDAQKQPAYDLSSFYNIDDIWRNFPLPLKASDVLRRKLSHLTFELYVTPSVDYRELNGANGKAARSYAAIGATGNYQLNENRSAKHLPALGAEIGFALGYKLSNALTLKGGLQFNMRAYGVRTFGTQFNNTSSDARTTNTVNNALPDNNTDDASAGAVSGTQAQLYYNRYYQIAAPIGIDWRIFTSDNGRLTVHTAIAAQPTYTFDRPSFLISTEPKSFVDGSSILRNWNLNSAGEAYVSYKIGGFRWQIGPQIRYQHLSSFSNSYPIREHLIDYGVKIGFIKSLD